MSYGKAKPHIPAAMRGVCFECGQRGHFGRDCPVRKANDGRRGKKRVKFAPVDEEEEEDDDDDDDPLARRGGKRKGVNREADDDDDDDDDDEPRGLEATDAPDGGGDDDDEEDAPVRAMQKEVDGEEDETNERFNEVGERIEPFNLRAERANDGFFDANGNFVWKKGPAEPDAWLASMDEAEEEAAVGEMMSRRSKMDEDDDDDAPAALTEAGKREKLAELAGLLEPGETVAAAVRRVGRQLKSDPAAAERFEALTAAADALVGAGRAGVYEEKREALEADAKPPQPARKIARPDDERKWEYRAKDGKVYGPYPTQSVLDWQAAGYFTGDGGVPMREYVAPPAPKNAGDELAGDLEDSDDDAAPADHNPNRWMHSDDIDFVGDGVESPLP